MRSRTKSEKSNCRSFNIWNGVYGALYTKNLNWRPEILWLFFFLFLLNYFWNQQRRCQRFLSLRPVSSRFRTRRLWQGQFRVYHWSLFQMDWTLQQFWAAWNAWPEIQLHQQDTEYVTSCESKRSNLQNQSLRSWLLSESCRSWWGLFCMLNINMPQLR